MIAQKLEDARNLNVKSHGFRNLEGTLNNQSRWEYFKFSTIFQLFMTNYQFLGWEIKDYKLNMQTTLDEDDERLWTTGSS